MITKRLFLDPPKTKFYLGGSNSREWRDELISAFNYYGIEYFDPTSDAIEYPKSEGNAIYNNEKNNSCNVHFYYIDKDTKGVFPMVEVMKSCYDAGESHYDVRDDSYYKANSVCMVILFINTDGIDDELLNSYKSSISLMKSVSKLFVGRETSFETRKKDLLDLAIEINDGMSYKKVNSNEEDEDEDDE